MLTELQLPRCPLTDLPRLFCGCPDHGNGFTMTSEERAFLAWSPARPTEPTSSSNATVVELPEYRSRPWTARADVKVADSTTPCRVRWCTKPAGDAMICTHCADDLEVALADLPALIEDLMVLATRQHRMPAQGRMIRKRESTRWDPVLDDGLDHEGTRRRLDERKMLANAGYNTRPDVPRAGDTMAQLGGLVTAAVKTICQHRQLTRPVTSGDPVADSVWLLQHVHDITQDGAGPQITEDLIVESRAARRLIDRPDERVYIGLCDRCRAPMHARPDQPTHTCATCGTDYPTAERREALSARILGSLFSLRELADLSAQHLGQRLTIKQLEGWVRRRRLHQAGTRPFNGSDQALYRAGDVLALVDERRSSKDDTPTDKTGGR